MREVFVNAAETVFQETHYFSADKFVFTDRINQDCIHTGTVTAQHIGKQLITDNGHFRRRQVKLGSNAAKGAAAGL